MRWLGLLLLCQPLLSQGLSGDPSSLSVKVRMVEVYAAVLDHRGKHIPGLDPSQFEIMEDGQRQEISLFKPQAATVTAAILIDCTGSMARELPHVKNAVAGLLTAAKPEDSFGLFAFSNRLKVLQSFTQNRRAVLKALLETRAMGDTALFDSLAQLARELSGVDGKRAILLFTDGDDNASVLSPNAAVESIKRTGIPMYTIAQGQALKCPQLIKRLEEISKATGGLLFEVNRTEEIAKKFQEIEEDLQHLYLLGYYSSNQSNSDWRRIMVRLPHQRGAKIRAKEGYRP
jgi:Ca-activated chloride channel homolog